VKRLTTLLILMISLAAGLYGQEYRNAVGLRLGSSGGITFRRFLGTGVAGEVMLSGQSHGTALTFLFEKHRPSLFFDDVYIDFFYGAGVHVGTGNRSSDKDWDGYNRLWEPLPLLGIDGYVSFEYTLPRYPLVINLDCKPYLELFDEQLFGINMPGIGFGVKYIF